MLYSDARPPGEVLEEEEEEEEEEDSEKELLECSDVEHYKKIWRTSQSTAVWSASSLAVTTPSTTPISLFISFIF